MRNYFNWFKHVKIIILYLFISISAAGVNSCSTNKATGEKHFNIINEDQEIQMGKNADKDIVSSIGIYNNAELQNYVKKIGMQMAAKSERPNLPWTFRVVDDPAVNAFALPGGFVYVTRGILTHITSEAELAGVMGHEIGHVTAKHSVYRISDQQLTQLGLGVAMVLKPELQKYGQLANIGLGLLFLKFSRDDERQADQLGVRYMQTINEDPRQMIEVMRMLDDVTKSSGGDRIPEWLATHPSPQNRIALLQDQINSLGGNFQNDKVDRDQYLSKIDGIIFGENPREGYFEGNTFYQPDLKFSFQFPPGWKTVNQKEAVIGVNQNQDAIIQISLAKDNSPEAAARNLFSQQGINGEGIQPISISGMKAVAGGFSASTDQGDLAGQATFVSYGGNIYQILSYSIQDKWPSYQNSLINSVRTFNQVNDASKLNVQPKKIKIITLTKDLTFQQFIQQYPSTISADQVALINQVQSNAQLKSGRKMKQVIGGK